METRVKSMIKLIEINADTFAKKAELYFKNRPELVNLVEETYRFTRRSLIDVIGYQGSSTSQITP
jgi:hypothetical protein